MRAEAIVTAAEVGSISASETSFKQPYRQTNTLRLIWGDRAQGELDQIRA